MAERFDLDAVAADDALLDLLAAGGDAAFETRQSDDVAVQLLAGLRLAVEDVTERPEPVLVDAEGFLARVAARNPVTDPLTPVQPTEVAPTQPQEPATTDPTATEPSTTDPSTTEPSTTDPSTTEP